LTALFALRFPGIPAPRIGVPLADLPVLIDASWEYYLGRYESLKAASALGVPKRALLSEELDVGDLPAFSEENGARIVAVEDGFPENGVVRKIVSSKTPKHFAGLSSVVAKSKGSAYLDHKGRVG
jgi:hypothetical protein